LGDPYEINTIPNEYKCFGNPRGSLLSSTLLVRIFYSKHFFYEDQQSNFIPHSIISTVEDELGVEYEAYEVVLE
jgi:hypothetical protein